MPTTVVLRLVVMTAVVGGLLFATAGTIAWPAAWICLGLMAVTLVTYTIILARLHPDLIEERIKPPAGAKAWDKYFVACVGAIGPVLLIVVAGFDRRMHWSAAMPGWLVAAGLVLVAAGGALTNYAVASNRFFSALVRIQRDRGHRVVDTGPYRLVRHPGYVGSIVHMFGTGLALGSRWTVVAAALVTLVLALRTALEDRTLQAELEGYADYARRVRFRLVPGLW